MKSKVSKISKGATFDKKGVKEPRFIPLMICPDCGSRLIPSSGCSFCPSCGWSFCS